jgi:hypothetical protein
MWIHLAQDREQWWAIVKTVMNVVFEVLTEVVMKRYTFWDTTPYSPLKFNRRFEGTSRPNLSDRKAKRETTMNQAIRKALLGACFMLVSCLTYSSTLKIKATFFIETSVDF